MASGSRHKKARTGGLAEGRGWLGQGGDDDAVRGPAGHHHPPQPRPPPPLPTTTDLHQATAAAAVDLAASLASVATQLLAANQAAAQSLALVASTMQALAGNAAAAAAPAPLPAATARPMRRPVWATLRRQAEASPSSSPSSSSSSPSPSPSSSSDEEDEEDGERAAATAGPAAAGAPLQLAARHRALPPPPRKAKTPKASPRPPPGGVTSRPYVGTYFRHLAWLAQVRDRAATAREGRQVVRCVGGHPDQRSAAIAADILWVSMGEPPRNFGLSALEQAGLVAQRVREKGPAVVAAGLRFAAPKAPPNHSPVHGVPGAAELAPELKRVMDAVAAGDEGGGGGKGEGEGEGADAAVGGACLPVRPTPHRQAEASPSPPSSSSPSPSPSSSSDEEDGEQNAAAGAPLQLAARHRALPPAPPEAETPRARPRPPPGRATSGPYFGTYGKDGAWRAQVWDRAASASEGRQIVRCVGGYRDRRSAAIAADILWVSMGGPPRNFSLSALEKAGLVAQRVREKATAVVAAGLRFAAPIAPLPNSSVHGVPGAAELAPELKRVIDAVAAGDGDDGGGESEAEGEGEGAAVGGACLAVTPPVELGP